MNQDQDQIKLLSIFHYVVAGMAALFSCFPVFHLIFGIAMILSPQSFNSENQPPPPWLGWFFIGIAGFAILLGWTFAVLLFNTGRSLAKHHRYTFCLVMACLECFFMPFGTVLGVFTIMVLMRPSTKQLFGVETPSPPPPSGSNPA